MYFSTHGNFNLIEQDYARDYQYLVRYPNNMALLLIVSLVGRLNYLIFGHYVDFAPVVVNILAINISIMLTAFTAKDFSATKGSFVLAFVRYFYLISPICRTITAIQCRCRFLSELFISLFPHYRLTTERVCTQSFVLQVH